MSNPQRTKPSKVYDFDECLAYIQDMYPNIPLYNDFEEYIRDHHEVTNNCTIVLWGTDYYPTEYKVLVEYFKSEFGESARYLFSW